MSREAICRWSGKNGEKKSDSFNPVNVKANKISSFWVLVFSSPSSDLDFWWGRLKTELTRSFTLCDDIFFLISLSGKLQNTMKFLDWLTNSSQFVLYKYKVLADARVRNLLLWLTAKKSYFVYNLEAMHFSHIVYYQVYLPIITYIHCKRFLWYSYFVEVIRNSRD